METGRRRYEEKPAVPERILRAISEYNWNGNITELKNTIEILLDLSSPIGIDPQKEALDADVLPFLALDDPMVFLEQYSYQEAVEKVDAYLIRRALEKTNWNQTRAAKSLNMTEGNIRRKIKKYRIIKPR
jgi:transcriptional regulator with PAS, ATPase and Fis domain